MGRKNGKSNKGSNKLPKESSISEVIVPHRVGKYKISPQKRNELNQLVDKLLKVTSVARSAGNSNVKKDFETHLQIHKILTKIMILESDINIPLPSRNENAERELLAWLESNGVEIDGVEIAQFSGYGYGLKAKRDLAEGEKIITIPRKVTFCQETFTNSLLDKLAEIDTMVRLMPNVYISLLLLIERFRTDKPSFFTPYINMLPNSYTTILYFSPEELQELKGSPTLESALKQCRNIARQYAYFYNIFQNKCDPASEILRDVFTYDQYRWAVSTVMTRQNFIPTYDCSINNALIPMWDLANHSNGKISTNYNLNTDSSECFAWRDFVAGEQVFIFYGARSNADLLVHNGFIYPPNNVDSYKIRLGVSKSDPLEYLKSLLLQRLELPMAADFSILCGQLPIENKLLAFVRIFNMNQEQLQYWIDHDRSTDLMHVDCALETELDNKTWSFLQARIKLLATLYPTKLEDDLKIDLDALTEHKKMAVQLRICEKSILQRASEYVEQRIKS
uniref:protein-histidine N-methyltransferase n=1 Tax=Clastoptera arizonana TaxID=38151 RepID=A0A1B6DPA2_9HEMI